MSKPTEKEESKTTHNYNENCSSNDIQERNIENNSDKFKTKQTVSNGNFSSSSNGHHIYILNISSPSTLILMQRNANYLNALDNHGRNNGHVTLNSVTAHQSISNFCNVGVAHHLKKTTTESKSFLKENNFEKTNDINQASTSFASRVPADQLIQHKNRVIYKILNYKDSDIENEPSTSNINKKTGTRNSKKLKTNFRDKKIMQETKYTCKRCPKSYLHKRSLRHHVIKNHKSPFKCRVCKKRFDSKDKLRCHKMKHDSSLRPFKCPICPSRFIKKSSVTRHLCSVHKTNPWICKECDKSFLTKPELIYHKAKDHDDRNYYKICESCPKAYADRRSLQYHKEKKHPSENTFE